MIKYQPLKESLQRRLFLSKLENLTNTGLIKSEVEYKRYLTSVLSTLNKHNTQLFDSKDFQIKYSDFIAFKTYKESLELIYYDLFTNYTETDKIKEFLKNNLNKNKQFYKNIRERIRHYWKSLALLRANSYDVTSSTKSFIESFFNRDNNFYMENCEINDKVNTLHLTPMVRKQFNNSIDIDRINVSITPVENDQGGVFYTHTDKNSLEYNYKYGKRDMLQNGLWKIQLLTEGIPECYLDINSKKKRFYGITATMDIYFTGMKPINRIYIEPYGEFYTKIITIQYLKDNTWKPFRKYDNNTGTYNPISGEKIIFDFMNIECVSTNAIRIIFSQENYKTLDNYIFNQTDAFSKLIKEIQENRYDFINKIDISDKYLTKPSDPTNLKNTTLEAINNIIFETDNFTDTENKIRELLFPSLKNIQFNSNWRVYELGAWEINPQYMQFSDQGGTFCSHIEGGYSIEKLPFEVSLTTKEELPDQTFIEYYITDEKEKTFVPFMPLNQKRRKEINRMKIYPQMYTCTSIWPDYWVLQTDFPIQEDMIPYTNIYINGSKMNLDTNWKTKVCFYNSRTIYIMGYKYNPKDTVVIEYYPDKLNTVEVWCLKPNNTDLSKVPHDYNWDPIFPDGKDPGMHLDHGMLFATKEAAMEFLFLFDDKIESFPVEGFLPVLKGSKNMQISYTPILTYCNFNEFKLWFLNGQRSRFYDYYFADPYKGGVTVGPLVNDGFFDSDSYIRATIGDIYTSYTRSSWMYADNPIYVSNFFNPFSKNSDLLPPHFGGKTNIWMGETINYISIIPAIPFVG